MNHNNQIFSTGFCEKNCIYSVKSGYKILCDEARSEEASGFKQKWRLEFEVSGIWKLKVPGKIKHFLLKASLDSLPTKANLLKSKIIAYPSCHLCGSFPGDVKHALWDCEAVKIVWCKDFSWVNRFEAANGTFLDLMERLTTKPGIADLFATTAWLIWTHRNKSRLLEKTTPLGSIGEAAKSWLPQFRSSREEHCCGKLPR